MFFRRKAAKVATFAERVDILRRAGFDTAALAGGRVKITKHGVGAVIGDEVQNHPEIDRAGILVNGEIATLLSAGYQMFLETPSGIRIPATADQLRALHQFEDDVMEALGIDNLYNTSLGTTSASHQYDRLLGREPAAPGESGVH